jgi:PIN domain nuclease of toxin-antitoxin system
VGLKVKRGKLEIPLSISEYARRLQRLERLQIAAVDVPIWLENLALDWEHRDPADRAIVAKDGLLDCELITTDWITADYYPKVVW